MTEDEYFRYIANKVKVENELDWLKSDIAKAEEAKVRAIVIYSAMREWNTQRERAKREMER